MRTEYLAAIVLAAFVAGAGLAAQSIQSQADYCPQPSASSVTALFAPCQTFDAATDHVSKPEVVRMGLLTPAEQRTAPPATRFAARLAESVDRFLSRPGG